MGRHPGAQRAPGDFLRRGSGSTFSDEGLDPIAQNDGMFIGMVPADRPRFVIGVLLGRPTGEAAHAKQRQAQQPKAITGPGAAAPAFAQLVAGLQAAGRLTASPLEGVTCELMPPRQRASARR